MGLIFIVINNCTRILFTINAWEDVVETIMIQLEGVNFLIASYCN